MLVSDAYILLKAKHIIFRLRRYSLIQLLDQSDCAALTAIVQISFSEKGRFL